MSDKAETFLVSYSISSAAEDVRMTRKQLQRFLTANNGKLTKDRGEFEDDYASDRLDFLSSASISWSPA